MIYHYISVKNAGELLVLLDIFQDGGDGSDGFVGDSRQGVERAASFHISENHDGSRSQLVHDDFGRVRDIGLGQIDGQNVQSAAAEDGMHFFQLAGMAYQAPATAQACQNGLGDIVFGGSQASGGDDNVVLTEFP